MSKVRLRSCYIFVVSLPVEVLYAVVICTWMIHLSKFVNIYKIWWIIHCIKVFAMHFSPSFPKVEVYTWDCSRTLVCVCVFVNDQLDAQFFFVYLFIPILYMFRATNCSSSGESILSIRPLVYVTLCRWPCGMQV